MQTGENEQGLRKILDLTRMSSILLLLVHIYYYCYRAFALWGLRWGLTDGLLQHMVRTGLFRHPRDAKALALALLAISLLGTRGKKEETIGFQKPVTYILGGLLLYVSGALVLEAQFALSTAAALYISLTVLGYLGILTGGTLLSRIIHQRIGGSVFNAENETFPQEERLLQNEYSVNLPATYHLKGKVRRSWINIINPFRGLLVMGTPGSGKSYFVIQHIIRQHIKKGFSMFVYDFKFDDLTLIAYNQYLKYRERYKVTPQFYVINFDDLDRSHRCNPLDPSTLKDITDAAESSRAIMLGLNHEWIKKSGDFFVESPIIFVTALIWFLRKYKGGQFCTLPHVIELAQVDYEKLFSVLRAEPEIEVLVNPFVTAYLNGANEQLEGQIASAKISLSKLSSEKLYYILSGNDFSLDINHPLHPKIVCMGNNPQKTGTYGAVLSLYITAMTRVMNRKGCHKSSLIFDEFPTIYFNGMDHLIATARSNRVATTVAVQDASQLKLHYGREQAEVIINIIGNIISGQVSGDTAKGLSERFGKTLQDRQSLSINRNDTSLTKSRQLELAVPVSKIASLSSGEFVGLVADNPEQLIPQKAFCASLRNDHEALAREAASYEAVPAFSSVQPGAVGKNYRQVKKDVAAIIETEIGRLLDTPDLSGGIIRKET